MRSDDAIENSFQAIIFDLDGTLLDTLADICDSVNAMLMEFGYPVRSLENYRQFIGDGIRMLVSRALPPAERSDETVSSCVQRAREIYWDNWNRKTRPYDGITDLLSQLKAKSLPMAVLSNKPHDLTVRYVKSYFNIMDFKMVLGQNEDFPVKPDPAAAIYIARRLALPASKVLFLGDSAVDMQTAASAGMHSVGAGWGFRGPNELVKSGCRNLVSHPMEILHLLR